MKYLFIFITSILLFISCTQEVDYQWLSFDYEFKNPTEVRILGYTGDAMEPFITRDGKYLFFNNLNSSEVNTNIYYAEYIDDSTFQFIGEIENINSSSLDAVPSMDENNNLYFISTRSYDSTVSTIYKCVFDNGIANNIELVDGVSLEKGGYVNFDVEISQDGNTMYFVDSKFTIFGTPDNSYFVYAKKTDEGFVRQADSDSIFENINTEDGLEYAACISDDQLTFYYTHYNKSDEPKIYMSKRIDIDAKFGLPIMLANIDGFVEAPAIYPDNKKLYYHKKVGDVFKIYYVKRE